MGERQTILLATDLRARTDRAMDRAAKLMDEWHGRLLVVHVVEPPALTALSDDELAVRARRELCEQLREAGDRVEIRVERGEPAEVIQRIAREERCSLIVTGVARNERFGRIVIGNTVEGVIRGLEVPLLVVADRARAAYRWITVAVDFDDASRDALVATAAMFPDASVTAFHAHDAPGSFAAVDLERHREAFTTVAEEDMAAFLEKVPLPEEWRARLVTEVQFGDPAAKLVEWTETRHVELVVVGTRGRGRLGELLLGSVAKRVLAALRCDVLVVPNRGA
ncbi:MAG TPA: universal stress protein [Kofleriaceae bacterium]|nr:universal stress protein [Kofleriaceae bacterium]